MHNFSQKFLIITAILLFSFTITGKSYAYDFSKLTKDQILEEKNIINEKGENVIELLIKTEKQAGSFVISPNTEKLENNKYKVYSEDNFYNDNGIWKLTEKATTTLANYQKISSSSLLEKLGFYTKALASYFYGGVDGRIYKQDSSVWATTHDATTATADTSSASNPIKVGLTSTPYFHIGRGYFNFDTSALPDSETVATTTFHLYIISKTNGDNDGQDYFNLYSNNTATNEAIIGDDYDQTGTSAYASALDLGTLSTSAYNVWTFNATGLTAVSKTSYTKLALKEGHDAENVAYAGSNNTFNEINVYFSDQTGTSSDPYLTIITTGGGGGSSTSTSSTTAGLVNTGDIIFMLAVIIMLSAVIFFGLIFNTVKK